jgi:hypothetical protein
MTVEMIGVRAQAGESPHLELNEADDPSRMAYYARQFE